MLSLYGSKNYRFTVYRLLQQPDRPLIYHQEALLTEAEADALVERMEGVLKANGFHFETDSQWAWVGADWQPGIAWVQYIVTPLDNQISPYIWEQDFNLDYA